MTDFKTWWAAMTSNLFWWQRTKEMYGKKDLAQVAQEVHLYLLGKGRLETATEEDIKDFRGTYLTFLKKAPDVTSVTRKVGVEVKAPEPQYLTGDARMNKLNEWLTEVKKIDAKPHIPKLSKKEIEEEGGYRPKNLHLPPPTEAQYIEVRALHLAYVRANYSPYDKDLQLPGWMPESEWTASLTEKERTQIVTEFLKNAK